MNAPGADVVAALVRQGLLAAERSGPSLGDLRRARVPLTDGEAATVAIPLAQALDALHDEGLAYGPPRDADVVFEPDGRPVLVVPHAWAASPDDDIPGLLRMVLAAMSPALPGDEPHDEPDLRRVLADLLARGCRSGAEVARACFDAVEAEPVRLPDAGALARASLLAAGARPASRPIPVAAGTTRDLTAMPVPLQPRPAGRAAAPAWPGAGRATEPLPRPAGWGRGRDVTTGAPSRRALRRRARRRSRMRIGSVVFVALAVIGAVLLRPAVGQAEAGPVQSPAALAIDPVLDRQSPAAAAAALTRERTVIIGAGDAAGLDAVDVPGGPALDADEDLLASLGDDRLEGLSVDVQATTLVDEADDEATVALTSAMSPYTRVGESGTKAVPGLLPRTVELHLRWTDAGWRVWDVQASISES